MRFDIERRDVERERTGRIWTLVEVDFLGDVVEREGEPGIC